jgi:hypothetical protein
MVTKGVVYFVQYLENQNCVKRGENDTFFQLMIVIINRQIQNFI